jgi:glycosyltransferase involved in cell wall biosynthesis
MRVLLAIHNVYTEFTSGAARSARTMMEWLAADGHACQVLSTARFEQTAGAELRTHLSQLGVTPRRRRAQAGCTLNEFSLAGVGVTAIETSHNSLTEEDREESRQFSAVFQEMSRRFRPDLVWTYSGHLVLPRVMRFARTRGARTLRSVRAYGYENRAWFENTDRVLFASEFLARYYRDHIGLRGTGIPSPLAWSEVQGPEDTRGLLTVVNPALHKGAALFARLADMLGQARPDIPILIVQSAIGAEQFAAIPGLDLARYPQIVVSPPIADAREIYALAKIVLMPSVFPEPFGRVAAEAMINGIPTLVSDRGALPETVEGGGIVLKLPAWMEQAGRRVPEPEDVRDWFDAVIRLWDDETEYQRVATAARETAHRLYDEASLRQRYLTYFTDPGPYPPLFDDEAAMPNPK